MYLILNQRSTSKNAYWDGFLSVLRNYPKEGLFLEIGAANPEQTKAHKNIFDRLIILDLSFERLDKSTGSIAVSADAQYLPFKDNSFDGIVTHHVIEHIDNDSLFLREIKRTLKSGGFTIIGTPNRRRLARAFTEIFTGKRKFPWWEHKREYTKEDLQNLKDDAGFKEGLIYGMFLGLHSRSLIAGFSTCPNLFERWCNFLFLALVK